MKKMVRVLSLVMLVAMCFSLMSVNAFAVTFGGDGTVIGGSTGNGNVSVGYDGTVYYRTDVSIYDTVESAQEKIDAAEKESETVEEINKKYAEQYAGDELYAILATSDTVFPMITENAAYLTFVGKNFSSLADAQQQTAYDIFGKAIMDAIIKYSIAVNDAAGIDADKYDAAAAYLDCAEEEKDAKAANLKSAYPEFALDGDEFVTAVTNYADDCYAKTRAVTNSAKALQNLMMGRSLMMAAAPDISGKTSKFSDVVPGQSSLINAVKNLDTLNFQNTFDLSGVTGYPLVIDLNNKTVVSPSGKAAFYISGKTFSFTKGRINGTSGFYIDTDANVSLNANVAINVSDTAVYVKAGTFSASDSEIVSQNSAAILVDGGTANLDSEGTRVFSNAAEEAAIQVDAGELNISGGQIWNDNAAGILVRGGVTNISFVDAIHGQTGIAVSGGKLNIDASDNSVISSTLNEDKDVLMHSGAAIYVKDGGKASVGACKLVSAKGYAIKADTPSNVIVAKSSVIDASLLGIQGDLVLGGFCIDGEYYATAKEASDAINASPNESVSITLINDVLKQTDPLEINPATAKYITIDGGDHLLEMDGANGIVVSKDGLNVVIRNITVDAPGSTGITVSGDSNVSLDSGTAVKSADVALNAVKGTVSVNDFVTMYTATGFNVKKPALVTVSSCKVTSAEPVSSGTDEYDSALKQGLRIIGGAFSERTTDLEDAVDKSVATLMPVPDSDKYYKVIMHDQPSVAILNGTTGYDENGVPYVLYDKSNPKFITFEVDPAVKRIDAISTDGGMDVENLKFSYDGKTGELVISDEIMAYLTESGKYDLKFTFENGYVMTGKLGMYVLPQVCKLVKSDAKTGVDTYQVGSDTDIYVLTSELPNSIAVGPDANGEDVRQYLLYNSDPSEANKVVTKLGDRNYLIRVAYSLLDELSTGSDYVFLDYSGAVKRLNLKITNPQVSISPSALDYWQGDGKATFTVKPDVLGVFIDGKEVRQAYYTYDPKTNKLVINGEYLNQLDEGDHTLEIETGRGWVAATVHTGVALRPIDVDYHVYGGAKPLAFQGSDVIDTTAGIWIGKNNPVKVDPSFIYFYDNNTKFTLSPSYLNRLALGTYYISGYVWNGEDYEYTSTTFRIVSASSAAYNPGTGDTFSPVLWIVVAALAAVIAAVFLVPALKKKGKNAPEKAAEEKIEESKKD